MWNDPGSPWHAQTGGPSIVRIHISVWGGKRQRRWILYWVGGVGKEKCFAKPSARTKQKVSDSLFPIEGELQPV